MDQRLLNKFKRNMDKGKKVTQQQAFNSMLEVERVNQMFFTTLNSMRETMLQFESMLIRLDANLGTLMHLLESKGIFDKKDWDIAWEACIVKPREAELEKEIETLKTEPNSKHVVNIIEKVRLFNWETYECDWLPSMPGKHVKSYLTIRIVDPATRDQTLKLLCKKLPDVFLSDNEDTDDHKHPDCHYCGEETCEFCKCKN